MKRTLFAAVAAAGLAACAPTGGDAQTSLASDGARESYSLGVAIAGELRGSLGDLDARAFAAGLEDAFSDRARLTPEEVAEALAARQQRQMELARAQQREIAERNEAVGEAYRRSFAEDPQVVTLDSGLQYKVLEEGDGAIPEPGDSVTVHYRGSFVDGTEFDSSYDRDEPVRFPVDRVIPGWAEALKRMPAGSRWQIVVPPELAYGDRGVDGVIEPNATLVFQVELVAVG